MKINIINRITVTTVLSCLFVWILYGTNKFWLDCLKLDIEAVSPELLPEFHFIPLLMFTIGWSASFLFLIFGAIKYIWRENEN